MCSGKPEERRSHSLPKRTFRWLGGGDAFRGSRRFPHHHILPRGIPSLTRARHPVFSRLTPGYLGGKLRYACDPWSVIGQTRASRPPPLQHRVPTRAARNSISRVPERRQPYPDCSGAFSVTGRPAIGNRHEAWTYDGPVSASRHPGRTYEPLDVFVLVSTSRDSDSEVWSQPLRHSGRHRAPWAPSACPRLPHPSTDPVAREVFR